MSSFDKTVKLACKPKAAPPKAKYLDPIVAATWADEGSVGDVCRALAPRFREPNAIIVFKALIVLHTMMRNGSTDNVLSYLSSSDVLRLRNVSAGTWDGYNTPQNLQHYAIYLDSRIRGYRELKHDAIRVQAENNRDMRNSLSMDEESYRNRKVKDPPKPNNDGVQRSKTIMGRKLGSMPVEKGLLKETRMVQKMIDALVECRFYLEDLEDELTITTLRMLVKDLLILVQACNEGVINVLENYFEMSRSDARQALELYRHFCKQTDKVDEYLGVAKKLQNLLNVSIPSLKSAPNSLAGALQEYLDDPNFEQNRKEYKAAKAAAERNTKNPMPKITDENQTQQKLQASTSAIASASPEVKNAKQKEEDAIDFFAAIENPQPNSPGPHNPFSQMGFGNAQQAPQFGIQPSAQVFAQHTAVPLQPSQSFSQFPSEQPSPSFIPSQQPTGLPLSSPMQGPSNPFSQPNMTGFQMPQQMVNTGIQHAPPMSQLRPQATGFLQPQTTGANPFRQSVLVPQTTGMALFGVTPLNGAGPPNTFGTVNTAPAFNQSQSAGAASNFPTSVSTSPFTPKAFGQNTQSNLPPRPASTPLSTVGQVSSSPPQAQPVQTHQTGSRNPFGPITKTPPPIPRAPTLMELAMGNNNNGVMMNMSDSQAPAQNAPISNTSSFNSSALNPGATDMSSVASSFSYRSKPNGVNGVNGPSSSSNQMPPSVQTTSPMQTNSFFSSTLSSQPTGAGSTTSSLFSSSLSTQQTGTSHSFFSSTLSSQPTGATSTSSPTSASALGLPSVKSHMTGFAGLKPFKPTSSFGAALLESLPPITDDAPIDAQPGISSPISSSSPQTGPGALYSQQTSIGGLRSQPTGGHPGGFNSAGSGPTLGQGLRPQLTGGGASNPFRVSTAVPGTSGIPSLPPLSLGSGFGTSSPSFATSGMQSTGVNLFGSSGSAFTTNTPGQQQQNSQSLI